jgi:hypothetical protein
VKHELQRIPQSALTVSRQAPYKELALIPPVGETPATGLKGSLLRVRVVIAHSCSCHANEASRVSLEADELYLDTLGICLRNTSVDSEREH